MEVDDESKMTPKKKHRDLFDRNVNVMFNDYGDEDEDEDEDNEDSDQII
jgi:hypothetical protein